MPLSNFNPRPPWGGRRSRQQDTHHTKRFQSTPSVGRATCGKHTVSGGIFISIHALRGEGDQAMITFGTYAINYFNPRPPWGGRRPASERAAEAVIFQSTPSVGRATLDYRPHLREFVQSFQSTPSVGRATPINSCFFKRKGISIHALRGEGDRLRRKISSIESNFNPRPPWGGRPALIRYELIDAKFQSTPSVGRATI